MSTIKQQLDNTIDLNNELTKLLSDLQEYENACTAVQNKQDKLVAKIDIYSENANAINQSLNDQQKELSNTISRIEDFIKTSDNALDRLSTVEKQLATTVKTDEFSQIRSKISDCRSDLTSLSGDIQTCVRRDDMDREISNLQQALQQSIDREAKLQRRIDDLTDKVKRLEAEQMKHSLWEQQIQGILSRINKLEQMPRGNVSISENNDPHIEPLAPNKTDTSVDIASETTPVDTKDDMTIAEKISGIIHQSSAMKQEILSETLTSISEVLEKHGIT